MLRTRFYKIKKKNLFGIENPARDDDRERKLWPDEAQCGHGQGTPQSGRVSGVSCGIILKSGITVLPGFLDPSPLLKITSHKEDFHLTGRREMKT